MWLPPLRKYSMMKFLTHEPIKDGWFNAQFTSGFGAFSPWERQLCNSSDVVSLMCKRMEADYLQTRENKRKPYNLAAIELWLHIEQGFHERRVMYLILEKCFADLTFELRKRSSDFVRRTMPVFPASRQSFQTASPRRRFLCWKKRCSERKGFQGWAVRFFLVCVCVCAHTFRYGHLRTFGC